MTTWTSPARERLDEYLTHARGRAARTGADADEVAIDLQRHIETEIAALRLPVVTDEDVRRIIARTGSLPEAEEEKDNTGKRRNWRRTSRHVISGLLLAFGVILPLVTLGFELVTHMCAATFFDPLPTWLHVLLVALVPAANAFAWWRLRTAVADIPRWLWLLNAAAFGTALYYTALFLPMSPFAVIGILYLGFGLLPLTPLIATICTLRIRRVLRLCHAEQRHPLPRRHWWFVAMAPVLVLALFALPEPLTRHWLLEATSDSPHTAMHAIKMLRTWGSEDALLRECYGRRNRLMDEFWSSPGVTPDQAQQVFYRVTGKAYNSVPPPLSKYQRSGRDLFNDFEWDAGLGTDAVAGQVKGLSMQSSRMDGLCNAAEGWAYTEWTMEFRNEHSWSQREARAQVQLPPGGVVSRLTLWVNGEPREAAFAGRGEVREAYQQIAVQQRRDPVLVTTSGPDRVLVQCFPIAPKGGVMKIRLGITSPLLIDGTNTSAFRLPEIVERNFKVSADFKHHCWMESASAATWKLSGVQNARGAERHAIRGDITDLELRSGKGVITFARIAEPFVQAVDPRQGTRLITQRIEARKNPLPPRIAVVLDGSKAMTSAYGEIARALDGFPRTSEIGIWLAQDGVQQLYNSAWAGHDTASRTVSAQRGVGGQDNVPALVLAWEWAQAQPDSVILWIHESQPVLLGSMDLLQQRLDWKQGKDAPQIIDVPVRHGPNRVAELLAGNTALTALPRMGALDADLERLIGIWAGRRMNLIYARSAAEPSATIAAGASGHVVRLWALDAVRELIASRARPAAVDLAAQQQIVTPVSGAVVLETAEQYRATGLTPADPATVPVVPEPGTWLLLMVGLVSLLGSRRLRARHARR